MPSHAFGWVPDVPDQRDYTYAVPRRTRVPTKVDLRPFCPPVYDQGALGSCTANAIGALLEIKQIQQKEPDLFTPSRLFIYYEERKLEDSIGSDAGAMIRDGMKVVANTGAPPETDWPYIIGKFTMQPAAKAYTDAPLGKAITYQRVPQNLTAMKACLASGNPIVIGFAVYDSFESDQVARTGVVPMPKKRETMLGGHAVLIVGYTSATKRFLVRNSWGPNWGMGGAFTIPFAYFLDSNLADDLWTASVVA